jgi:hypothetical protein
VGVRGKPGGKEGIYTEKEWLFYLIRSRDSITPLLKGVQGAEEHGSLHYRYWNKCKYASKEQKNEDETVSKNLML